MIEGLPDWDQLARHQADYAEELSDLLYGMDKASSLIASDLHRFGVLVTLIDLEITERPRLIGLLAAAAQRLLQVQS